MIKRQTNFLGGELDRLLWGRSDLDVFESGARTMLNFFVDKRGAAVSRPGTEFLGFGGGTGMSVRLIPFLYADDQSLCLEFGPGIIRFHTNGATVLNGSAPTNSITSGAGNPYTLRSPYAYYDLPKLKWAQTGDVLTLAHPSHAPRELRRISNTNWGALSADHDGTAYTTVLAEVKFAEVVPYFAPTYPVLGPQPTETAAQPKKEWIWLATLLVQETATGRTFETLPFRITQQWTGVASALPVDLPTALADNKVALYVDKPVTVWRNNGAILHLGALTNTADLTYREIQMQIYRGRGDPTGKGVGLYGLKGVTTTGEFVDDGLEPDYAFQPPRGTNPFLTYDYAGALVATKRPAAVAFFQERRCFAEATRLHASAVGSYTNFDPHVFQIDDEALLFEFAARQREEAVHILSHAKLLLFTKSTVRSFAGEQGSALAWNSIDQRLEDEVGSLDVPPLVVNGRVMFCRTKGVGVRGLVFDGNSYRGVDLSGVSGHLFCGQSTGLPAFIEAQLDGQPVLTQRSIIDWTYAEDPWGVVWACREDGVLLSYTPNGDGRGAWARHETDGWVRAVCAIPEGNEDSIYIAVARPISGSAAVLCIERMSSRVRNGTTADDAAVDCHLSYSGVPALTLTGLTHLAGSTVWVVGKGNPPQGPLVVSAAGEVVLPVLPVANDGANVKLFVGLSYTCDLETLDLVSNDLRTKPLVVDHVGFEVDQTQGVEVGQDFDHLVPGLLRTPAASYAMPVPETTLVRVPVRGTWGAGGRAVLRQSKPLPVTVVGLVREVSVGG